MSTTPLPQEGGAYTRDKKGDLKKVEGTAPRNTAPAQPAPKPADEESS